MNREGIRKPAYFAYKYLNALRRARHPDRRCAGDGGDRRRRARRCSSGTGSSPKQAVSNQPFYTRLVPSTPAAPVQLAFEHLAPGSYRLRAYRTGYRHNDAYSAYIDMGLPKTLDAAQRRKLQLLTRDLPIVERVVTVGAGGQFHLDLPMRSNDVVLVKLSRESSAPTASQE